tara:strand:- start:647 stop:1117 length:471 start_codon:yes stop_codon:yes gene_type:complete
MFRLILIFIIYFSFTIQVNSIEQEVIVKKKVNEFIITNLDIKREIKYIKSLNPTIADKIDQKEFLIYAENTLINEKIKFIELSKFFDMENINNIPDAVIQNFYEKLGFVNLKQFEEYLNINDLNYNLVIKKLYHEHLWNALIYQRYKKKLILIKKK